MTDQAVIASWHRSWACGLPAKPSGRRRPATTGGTGKARHRHGQSRSRTANGASRGR